MKTEYEYIVFTQQPTDPKRKTARYACVNRSSNDAIGNVAWYAAWRQFCFMPRFNTVFSAGCLRDIQDFLAQLMEARKK